MILLVFQVSSSSGNVRSPLRTSAPNIQDHQVLVLPPGVGLLAARLHAVYSIAAASSLSLHDDLRLVRLDM